MVERSDVLAKIFSFNPNYFAFISAILVSASINLLTAIATSPILPDKQPTILVSSIFFFISSFFSAAISTNLETIKRITIYDAPPGSNYKENFKAEIMINSTKLLSYLIGTVALAIFAILLLVIS